MLSEKRFYLVAALLPFVCPAILAGIVAASSLLGLELQVLGGFALVLVLGLVLGGAQYVILVVVVAFLWRHHSARTILRRVLLIPVVYSLFIGVSLGALAAYTDPLDRVATIAFYFSCWALAVGYGYVALGLALRAIAIRMRVVEREEAATGQGAAAD